MKTFLKPALLSVAAFVLASAGAVATNDTTSDAVKAQSTYYIHKPLATSCQAVTVNCTTTPGQSCMYNDGTANWQVYARQSTGANCNILLFRP